MKKLFIYSAMLVGLFSLQACDKKPEEKPAEEEKAATLFDYKLPTQKEAFYGQSKETHKSEKQDVKDRMKAFFGN